MSEVHWNAQSGDLISTDSDTVVLDWGIGSFDMIHAATLEVRGGVNATVVNTTAKTLVVTDGTIVNITGDQANQFDAIVVEGGAQLTITGMTTVTDITIGNGSMVFANGGLNATKFDISGGSQLHVSGYMNIAGTDVKNVGDVSYIWNTEMDSGSIVMHDRGDEPCYLKGTEILTPDGMRLIEDLKVGDDVLIVTDKNVREVAQIIWVGKGHHKVNPLMADGPEDLAGYPICIIRDAIAPGVPYKDLWVTPEHMVTLDNLYFIPVRMLVNDRTIFYGREIPEYDFYHFSVGNHEVVIANGFLSETYLNSDQTFNISEEGTRPQIPVPARAIDTYVPTILKWRNQLHERIVTVGDVRDRIDTSYRQDKYAPSFVNAVFRGEIMIPLRKTATSVTYMLPSLDTLLKQSEIRLHFVASRPVDEDPSVDDRRFVGPKVRLIAYVGTKTIDLSPWTSDNAEQKGWWPDGRPKETAVVDMMDSFVDTGAATLLTVILK